MQKQNVYLNIIDSLITFVTETLKPCYNPSLEIYKMALNMYNNIGFLGKNCYIKIKKEYVIFLMEELQRRDFSDSQEIIEESSKILKVVYENM